MSPPDDALEVPPPPGVTVQLADPDDAYFLDVWMRSYEGSVARLTDSLNRLVTLGTALTGGALVLLKEDVCYGWWRVVAAGMFFLALAAAVFGSVPVAVSMEFDPADVRAGLTRTSEVKKRWVWASSVLILVGLLAVLVGVAAKMYYRG